MLRIRFGKLAIAVLAVSGAAAHAEFGETGLTKTSFLDKFRGFTVGVEGTIPFVHENTTWRQALKTPYTESKLLNGYLNIPTSSRLGSVKVDVKVGIENFAADGLYNIAKATELKAIKPATKVAEATEEGADAASAASTEEKTVNVRKASEVNGGLLNAAFKLTYDLTESLYVRGTGGFGVIRPLSTDRYYAAIGSLGLGYKASSRVSFEGAVKHVYSFDKGVVNPLTGFTVGVNFTY